MTQLRRELESLLALNRSAAGFMETPAIAEPGAAAAVSDRVVPGIQSAMIQRRLGPYRLVAEVGRGGMDAVYLAERDDETFRRQVAIKVVHAGILHPSLVDRFEAERRILARLEHPNIARLLDAGTDQGGTVLADLAIVDRNLGAALGSVGDSQGALEHCRAALAQFEPIMMPTLTLTPLAATIGMRCGAAVP